MSTGMTVAKKKQEPAQRTKGKAVAPPRPETPGAEVPDFLRVRVSGAYKVWVARFAESERSDMSDLLDDALAAYAKARGFEAPPKR